MSSTEAQLFYSTFVVYYRTRIHVVSGWLHWMHPVNALFLNSTVCQKTFSIVFGQVRGHIHRITLLLVCLRSHLKACCSEKKCEAHSTTKSFTIIKHCYALPLLFLNIENPGLNNFLCCNKEYFFHMKPRASLKKRT